MTDQEQPTTYDTSIDISPCFTRFTVQLFNKRANPKSLTARFAPAPHLKPWRTSGVEKSEKRRPKELNQVLSEKGSLDVKPLKVVFFR